MLLMGAGGSAHVQPGLLDWLTSHWAIWVFVVGSILLTFGAAWMGWSFAKRNPDASRRASRQPPLVAEWLLCIFARTKDIDGLMGDFEERFARDCETGMSRWRAKVRYCARVIRSTGPQIWQAAKRVGWLGLIAAVMRR